MNQVKHIVSIESLIFLSHVPNILPSLLMKIHSQTMPCSLAGLIFLTAKIVSLNPHGQARLAQPIAAFFAAMVAVPDGSIQTYTNIFVILNQPKGDLKARTRIFLAIILESFVINAI